MGELPFRKGKVCCYWIIIFLCRVIKIKRSINWFFFLFSINWFFLKKLAVALTLVTALSLNSNVFCWFCLLVKIPLHCVNLQRQGTTLNLRIWDTFSPLSFKMPFKSVTSYQAEITLTLFWFLDFATVYSYFNIQMCSYLMLEIKSFVSLKNEPFLFWARVHFKGGS